MYILFNDLGLHSQVVPIIDFTITLSIYIYLYVHTYVHFFYTHCIGEITSLRNHLPMLIYVSVVMAKNCRLAHMGQTCVLYNIETLSKDFSSSI